MTTEVNADPYFDDEDEENEEIYRQLLRKRDTLPPCDPTPLPFSSISQPRILCSREEAETILKTTAGVRPGNFIVRPSAHVKHPYSLSLLCTDYNIYHFQICQISNKYTLGSLETMNMLTTQTFCSLSSFLEYYLTNPIKFQDNNDKKHSIILQLYSINAVTRL
ncbi:unnamed protein product [Rotaria sp. Silwood1]|nr:unnamed protein product [Rotaria sp. Silwood1]CAF4845316.1 unnamed protein product [Rotaria sp. Silwood1]